MRGIRYIFAYLIRYRMLSLSFYRMLSHSPTSHSAFATHTTVPSHPRKLKASQ